jgi:hydroxymethylpyrimidine pyrophosphatase-like HAD family hydrolase
MTMRNLAEWPAGDRRGIVGVFTDIDDTLTTEGVITGDALAALDTLRAAGIHVIAITGRPVGWSEPFALQWPVDAIVAENGAVALVRDGGRGSPHPCPPPRGEGANRLGHCAEGEGEKRLGPDAEGIAAKRLLKLYRQEQRVRAANFVRLQRAAQRILREVPAAGLARDSAGRETDIAIDHGEYVQLAPEAVAQVLRLMQDEGMNATVSSIHINGWYGDHDKLSAARWITRELFGRDLDGEIDRWVYVGDSTNDELMFEHFPHSIGVANIRRFEAQLRHPPRYITGAERGAGFAQVAQSIIASKPER